MPIGRLVRNALLWAIPVTLLWLAITPYYNAFLTRATENLVQLIERPDHTTLRPYQTHYLLIYRDDLRGQTSTGHVSSLRVTDYHFMLVFTAALFLAVPGVPWRRRLQALGWATLASVFFHLLSLAFRVQFVYATQLGAWSAEHYGAVARNAWGLSSHMLDFCFRFALPLVLWCWFFLDRLLPERAASG